MGKHRLFLGLPVPQASAGSLANWAERELKARTMSPENLHVTLLFFGEVKVEVRDELIELTHQAIWDPLSVTTGALDHFGRSALGIWLDAPSEQLENVAYRMAFSRWGPELEADERKPWEREWTSDPLYRMALCLPPAEMERKRRNDRHGRPWRPHLTLARTKEGLDLEGIASPQLAFALDRLRLYESELGSEGSRYTFLAEGRAA